MAGFRWLGGASAFGMMMPSPAMAGRSAQAAPMNDSRALEVLRNIEQLMRSGVGFQEATAKGIQGVGGYAR